MLKEQPMFDPKDVHSLSDFQRSAKAHVKRLRRTGRAELLTVNGKSAVIVQDAEAYAKMIGDLERQCTIEAVQVGIEQMEAGKLIPLHQVERELRAKYGMKSRTRKSA